MLLLVGQTAAQLMQRGVGRGFQLLIPSLLSLAADAVEVGGPGGYADMAHGLYGLQLHLTVRIPQIDHQRVAGVGVILHLAQRLYNGQTDRGLGVGGVLAQIEDIALFAMRSNLFPPIPNI